MKNKFVPILLLVSLVVLCQLSVTATNIEPGVHEATPTLGTFENFEQVNYFTYGQYTDVVDTDWYTENVARAYELGLMSGTSATTFNPNGHITVAETLVLACRIHNTFCNEDIAFENGTPWYQPYVEYALKNGIIRRGYANYNAVLSRAEFVEILYHAVSTDCFTEINTIGNSQIPDLDITDDFGAATYTFYRAGILTGNDAYGTFTPNEPIQRSSVAAIVVRMVEETKRIRFTPQKMPIMANKIMISRSAANIFIGENARFSVVFYPADTSDQSLKWTTSNAQVATVSNGTITGVGAGTATITATSLNGLTSSNTIVVEKKDSIKILSTPTIPNSAGGAGPSIIWRNDSGKTIKYIDFTATPYNAVGDVVSDSITGKTSVQLRATGPYNTFNNSSDIANSYFFYENSIPSIDTYGGYHILHYSGKTYYLTEKDYSNVFNFESSWDPVWYNYSICKVAISRVDIEYTDGTKETLYNPTIWHSVWWK